MRLKKLKHGDTIAFYSPSSPATCFAPKRFKRAKEYLGEKGFKLLPGNLTGKSEGYRSGNIEQRAEELNELLRNPDIDCIMSVIGGLNSNSLIPYIDYDAFRENPKIVMGHSDVTSILLALYAKTGIKTFYGPALIPSFGEFPPFVDETYNYFSDILIENSSIPFAYKMPESWSDEFVNWEDKTKEKDHIRNKWITVIEGETEGKIIGGTLNSITTILGTEYMPELTKGHILFIEDTSKTASFMERLFSILKVNKIFDPVGGIILGKHERFDDQKTSKKVYDILKEIAGDINIPFLAEFDCCHTHPMFTLPLGAKIKLDATSRTVSIVEKWMD